MKLKIRVLALLSLFLAVAALGIIGTTYGWFGPRFTLSTGDIAVGDLRFSETGAFIADGQTIVPGQELIATAIAVDNASPITSQLRVLVTYTKCTAPDTCVETTYSDDVADHLAVVFGTGFSYDAGYWYYSASEPGTDYLLPADSGALGVITSIYYDGARTGIDYAGESVEVTVSIQVKQGDNVAWTTLAGYDFSTGYPA